MFHNAATTEETNKEPTETRPDSPLPGPLKPGEETGNGVERIEILDQSGYWVVQGDTFNATVVKRPLAQVVTELAAAMQKLIERERRKRGVPVEQLVYRLTETRK